MTSNANQFVAIGSANARERLAYRRPQLALLGSVRTLTESGSGAQLEPSDGMGMCNSAIAKMC